MALWLLPNLAGAGAWGLLCLVHRQSQDNPEILRFVQLTSRENFWIYLKIALWVTGKLRDFHFLTWNHWKPRNLQLAHLKPLEHVVEGSSSNCCIGATMWLRDHGKQMLTQNQLCNSNCNLTKNSSTLICCCISSSFLDDGNSPRPSCGGLHAMAHGIYCGKYHGVFVELSWPVPQQFKRESAQTSSPRFVTFFTIQSVGGRSTFSNWCLLCGHSAVIHKASVWVISEIRSSVPVCWLKQCWGHFWSKLLQA